MQNIKKRGLGGDVIISVAGMFGYTNIITSACGLILDTVAYRDTLDGYFAEATILATSENLTIFAPEGYYSEYSVLADAVISRYWNGTGFVGLPEIC